MFFVITFRNLKFNIQGTISQLLVKKPSFIFLIVLAFKLDMISEEHILYHALSVEVSFIPGSSKAFQNNVSHFLYITIVLNLIIYLEINIICC